MPSIRTILWGVNVALLGLLAYSAAVLAAVVVEGVLVENTPPPAPPPAAGGGREVKRPRPFAAFREVLDVNAFRAERSAPAAPQRSAPRTAAEPATPSDKFPLPITVTGTLVMGRTAVAFLADGSGKRENVYHVGECFPQNGDLPNRNCAAGQAQLTKIGADRVLLEINQRGYEVKIGEGETGQTVAAAAPAPTKGPPRPSRGRANVRPARQNATPFPSEETEDGLEFHLPNTEVEKAFENFSSIVNDARVVPYLVEGEAQGFQIRRIRAGSIFQKIGLQNQDILKTVNGESLTTADQALRLFTLFRNEREIVLEIERDGQDMSLSYLVE